MVLLQCIYSNTVLHVLLPIVTHVTMATIKRFMCHTAKLPELVQYNIYTCTYK